LEVSQLFSSLSSVIARQKDDENHFGAVTLSCCLSFIRVGFHLVFNAVANAPGWREPLVASVFFFPLFRRCGGTPIFFLVVGIAATDFFGHLVLIPTPSSFVFLWL